MMISAIHQKVAEKYVFRNFWPEAIVPDSLVKLVKHMYTEEEAEIINALKFRGQTAKAVARKVGRNVNEVEPLLKSLDERVLIFSQQIKNIKLYFFLQMLPGCYETQMVRSKNNDDVEYFKEFAKLFRECYEEFAIWIKPKIESKDLRFGRIVPIERSIDNTEGLNILTLSTDRYSEIVERNNSFCLVDVCACRQEADLVGQSCGRPMDVCSAMGWVADFVINKGLGRRVTREEFLEAKTRAAEAGLVNMVDNLRDPLQVCSCCSCCCSAIKLIKNYNIPTIIAKSHFESSIKKESCKGCRSCVKICPMEAVSIVENHAEIDHIRCIGCGLCAMKCKNNAVFLNERSDHKPPAETKIEYALNRYFEIKGYENSVLPKVSLGIGKLLGKAIPFSLSGPGYKPQK